MKSVLLRFLFVAAGFGLSRFTPAGSGSARATESRPAASAVAAVGPAEGGPMQNAPSTSGQARWKTAAAEWAEQDPQGFHDWLVRRGIPPEEDVLKRLFQSWVKRDPNAALVAALNLPRDFDPYGIFEPLLSTILNEPGGLEMMLKWSPAAEDLQMEWRHQTHDWLEAAAPERIASLLAGAAPGQFYRSVLIEEFSKFWWARDSAAAMAWMRTLPPKEFTAAMGGIMASWSAKDPAAALEYLAMEAASGDRLNAFKPLAELAKTDPKAAIDWWDKNIGVAGYVNLRPIFSSWCAADAAAAREYALGIEDPSLRRDCMKAWAAYAKPEDVNSVILATVEGAERTTLIMAFLESSRMDQAKARFVRKLVEQGGKSITPEIAWITGNLYAGREKKTVLTWAGTLPEHLQYAAVDGAFRVWPDKASAVQAVENLPDGPFKTTAQKALETIATDR